MKKVPCFLAFFLLFTGSAAAQTTVAGTLLDQDGKPMPMANVGITRVVNYLEAPCAKVVEADKDGQYSITVDSLGVWELIFSGVNHAGYGVPIYLDKPEQISINVRLKTYDYADTFKNIEIEGESNNFNPYDAVPMKREPNGTFTAEVDTKDDSTFAYEIVGAAKPMEGINGTESERYVYDGRGSYKSVLTPTEGKVQVVFNPDKLVRSDKPVRISFADSESFNAKFAGIFLNMVKEAAAWRGAYSRYKATGKDANGFFKYDWSKELKSLGERIKGETNGMLRQELYLNYICVLPQKEM